jgi:hypothetical protein
MRAMKISTGPNIVFRAIDGEGRKKQKILSKASETPAGSKIAKILTYRALILVRDAGK